MKPTQEFLDQILILRCQLRDREALAELIDRYQRPLRYFITRLIGNPDRAEEFCQETWLTVLGKIHTLRDAGTFNTWLYRIARNYDLLHGLALRPVADAHPASDSGPSDHHRGTTQENGRQGIGGAYDETTGKGRLAQVTPRRGSPRSTSDDLEPADLFVRVGRAGHVHSKETCE